MPFAELPDECRLDLALRVAGGDPLADERTYAVGDRGVRERERRLAGGAVDLVLELLQRWTLLARERGRGERKPDEEREHDSAYADHGASAFSMLCSSAAASTAPAT